MSKKVLKIIAAGFGTLAGIVIVWMLQRRFPHVVGYGAKEHGNKNFNAFPIDIPPDEFENWLS